MVSFNCSIVFWNSLSALSSLFNLLFTPSNVSKLSTFTPERYSIFSFIDSISSLIFSLPSFSNLISDIIVLLID